MKTIAILAAVAILCGCERTAQPPLRGVVLGKYHRAAHTSMIWISHGPRRGGHFRTIHHPARWEITIRPPWGRSDGEYDKTLNVTEGYYDGCKIGDVIGPEVEKSTSPQSG